MICRAETCGHDREWLSVAPTSSEGVQWGHEISFPDPWIITDLVYWIHIFQSNLKIFILFHFNRIYLSQIFSSTVKIIHSKLFHIEFIQSKSIHLGNGVSRLCCCRMGDSTHCIPYNVVPLKIGLVSLPSYFDNVRYISTVDPTYPSYHPTLRSMGHHLAESSAINSDWLV